jgi:hypothetical protein
VHTIDRYSDRWTGFPIKTSVLAGLLVGCEGLPANTSLTHDNASFILGKYQREAEILEK